jgi:hypothetical protein
MGRRSTRTTTASSSTSSRDATSSRSSATAKLETIEGTPGTAIHVPPNVPHTFTSAGETAGRLLFVHTPAGLEEFFEEFGVPVERVGDVPDGLEPPDPAKMGPALERHGIRIVGAPQAA